MRSYHQHCSLARALDVVGDRWTLLIVRELLVRPCRYRDLLDGLPGVATNLLTERLRHLEANDVVEWAEAGGPGDRTAARYRLTERGRALAPAVHALGHWGAPLMACREPVDAVRGHWFVVPIQSFFPDVDPDRPQMTVELEIADEPLVLVSSDGRVTVGPGPATGPTDLVVSGPPEAILALLAGRFTPTQARTAGLRVTGTGGFGRLTQLRPGTPARAASSRA